MKKLDGKELWSPLSAAQASRWFLYQLDPASQASHNIVFSARLLGLIDTAHVAGAVQQLVQRHPMLRTRFQYIDGEPAQSTAHRWRAAGPRPPQPPLRRRHARRHRLPRGVRRAVRDVPAAPTPAGGPR